jgi:hypothetical protein
MLAGGYSWRLYFYVIIAFAGALFIMAFIFVEETHYDRKLASPARSPTTSTMNGDSELKEDKGDELRQHVEEANVIPPRKSFLETLKPWSKIDHEAEFFMTMVRSFTYIPVPAVFWVITSFGKDYNSSMHIVIALTVSSGIYIGLGALAFNYTFPIKIVAPPYNWKAVSPHTTSLQTNRCLTVFRKIPV